MDQQNPQSAPLSPKGDINKQLEDIEKLVDAYEQNKIGLAPSVKAEQPEYLGMSTEELRKKTPQELSEACYSLNLYCFYLQRMINKEEMKKNWALSKLEEVAGDQLPNVAPHYGWSERMLLAKTQHPLAKRLQQIIRESSCYLDRMKYIPSEIHKLTDTIKDIKFSLINKERNNNG